MVEKACEFIWDTFDKFVHGQNPKLEQPKNIVGFEAIMNSKRLFLNRHIIISLIGIPENPYGDSIT